MKNIVPKQLNDFKNNSNNPEEYLLKLGANNPAEESQSQEEWLTDDYEGQLAIDVYETPNNMVIKSAIAGVKPEDLGISITNDMLTIRGKREQTEEVKDDNYFYRECFWGGFSRSIILPTEVNTDAIDANLKNGVLTITLPKIKKGNSINIPVKGEEE
jgi:HSP20 family protein